MIKFKFCLIFRILYYSAQTQGPPAPNDFMMPQPQVVAPSSNAFFSPQTAFYTSSSQQQMSSNQTVPGMEYLSNNPLLNAGFNVVEQGMRDFTGKTVNMLPNEVKEQELCTYLY